MKIIAGYKFLANFALGIEITQGFPSYHIEEEACQKAATHIQFHAADDRLLSLTKSTG